MYDNKQSLSVDDSAFSAVKRTEDGTARNAVSLHLQDRYARRRFQKHRRINQQGEADTANLNCIEEILRISKTILTKVTLITILTEISLTINH